MKKWGGRGVGDQERLQKERQTNAMCGRKQNNL